MILSGSVLLYSMIAVVLSVGIIVVVLLLCWNQYNQYPQITVPATVVTKRMRICQHDVDSTSTHYYVTFQFDDGRRIELRMRGKSYGMLAEGDRGELSYQGTRYLGFTRK